MNSVAKPRRWEAFFWPAIAAAVLLAVWHYSVVLTGTKIFPSPTNVKTGVIELLHKNVLWADIGDSLRRVAVGFGAAVLVGIPVGLWLGWSAKANQVVNPTLQILRPISPIAWIPVAIIFFRRWRPCRDLPHFSGVVFPIVLACVSGSQACPPFCAARDVILVCRLRSFCGG